MIVEMVYGTGIKIYDSTICIQVQFMWEDAFHDCWIAYMEDVYRYIRLNNLYVYVVRVGRTPSWLLHCIYGRCIKIYTIEQSICICDSLGEHAFMIIALHIWNTYKDIRFNNLYVYVIQLGGLVSCVLNCIHMEYVWWRYNSTIYVYKYVIQLGGLISLTVDAIQAYVDFWQLDC